MEKTKILNLSYNAMFKAVFSNNKAILAKLIEAILEYCKMNIDIKGKEIITDPKTPKSKRTVQMPTFLNDEMQDYINSIYGLENDMRIFPISKSYLHHEMNRGCKATGVKRIRIHDLRHSHVSLLIDKGFTAVDIANRVGHESIDITFRYAHMFPTKQNEIAKMLDVERGA